MKINVVCNNAAISRAAQNNMMTAIEACATKSQLATLAGDNLDIDVVLNPELEQYDHYEQVTNRIYTTFEGSSINIDRKALGMFKMYCIGLSTSLFKEINSVMLTLVARNSDSAKSTQSESKGDNASSDDEATQSYQAVNPIYTLDKVILSEDTKGQIDRAISLVEQRDKIFNEWGYSEVDPHTKTILCFYGAPGTGKTMCAHAVAARLNKKILLASYASIESKWVGEGPKNLQRIFSDAQEQDAVLFFDEADSFLSKRVNNAETGSDKHYNRMSNEMFQLLESYNGIIIFATNLVSDFDKAFKSRILAFIEFQEPDFETRKKLIDIMIPKRLPMSARLTDAELGRLAEISEGFSGREIRKSILTTLAEGATSNVSLFTIEEFERGFSSVKAETLAVNEMAKTDISSDVVTDFLIYGQTNKHVVDTCLYTAWQGGSINGEQSAYIITLCKALGCERPDMTISYINKDLTEAIEDIRTNGRVKETMKSCVELLALSSLTEMDKTKTLSMLAEKLECVEELSTYNELRKMYEKLHKA